MKKLLLGILTVALLTACGGGEDKYSYEEKVELTKKVMNQDVKATQEMTKVMQELQEKAQKGDKAAAEEIQEWGKATMEATTKQ